MFSWDFESINGHMFYVDTSVVGMLYQKLRIIMYSCYSMKKKSQFDIMPYDLENDQCACKLAEQNGDIMLVL
jgi:hypothetical protein